MLDDDRKARRKLERLREELAKGEQDLAAGRAIVLQNDEEVRRFFDRLLREEPALAGSQGHR